MVIFDPAFCAYSLYFCLNVSNSVFQASYFSLNQSEGVRSSIFCVIFCSRIHSFRRFSQLPLGAHSNLTSSNPSSLSGIVKDVNFAARVLAERSSMVFLRNHIFFSSSVSSSSSFGIVHSTG